jgi:hypothetical protein
MFIDAKFFAKFLFTDTVYCANFDNAIKFFCQFFILLNEVSALLRLWIHEVEDPNLLAAVKLENCAKVELEYIWGDEMLWSFFLLLMSTCVKVVEAAALTEKVIKFEVKLLATPEALVLLSLALFMLLDSFRALLIVNSAFFGVWEDFVSVRYLLELFFGFVRVVPVFVRMIFNCQLFECFFNLVFISILLDSHDLVIVIFRVFWFLRLPLATALLSSTSKLLSASAKLLATSAKVKFKLLSSSTWQD